MGLIVNTSDRPIPRQERINRAIGKVECDIDERLRSRELIGQVTDRKAVDRVRIKARRVTFTWQRGIKIGMIKYALESFIFLSMNTMHITIVNRRSGKIR